MASACRNAISFSVANGISQKWKKGAFRPPLQPHEVGSSRLDASQKNQVFVSRGDVAQGFAIAIHFRQAIDLVHDDNVREIEADAVGGSLRFLRHNQRNTFLLCEEVFVLTRSRGSDERGDDNRSALELADNGRFVRHPGSRLTDVAPMDERVHLHEASTLGRAKEPGAVFGEVNTGFLKILSSAEEVVVGEFHTESADDLREGCGQGSNIYVELAGQGVAHLLLHLGLDIVPAKDLGDVFVLDGTSDVVVDGDGLLGVRVDVGIERGGCGLGLRFDVRDADLVVHVAVALEFPRPVNARSDDQLELAGTDNAVNPDFIDVLGRSGYCLVSSGRDFTLWLPSATPRQ